MAKEAAELNELLVKRGVRAGGAEPAASAPAQIEPNRDQIPEGQAVAEGDNPARGRSGRVASLLPEPSDKVAMQNVQVRLPEPIADRLRLLAPLLRRKQQGILEEIITKGINDLWRRVEARSRGAE